MGGGPRAGFRGVDEEAQRRQNAEAPRIEGLGSRVVALFSAYRWRILVTGVLVVVGAGIAVIPPLLVQRIFDDALFPVDGGGPHLQLLAWLVGAMVALFLLSAGLGVVQTWLTATVGNSVTGDLRVRLSSTCRRWSSGSSPVPRPGSSSRACRTTSAGVRRAHQHRHEHPRQCRHRDRLARRDDPDRLASHPDRGRADAVPRARPAPRRPGAGAHRGETQESLSELTSITQETLSVSGMLLSRRSTGSAPSRSATRRRTATRWSSRCAAR